VGQLCLFISPLLIYYSTGVLRARWDPLYDLHAATDGGKPTTSVFLHYLVNLSQDTGEDWTNAKLILSTPAADALNAWVPHPDDLIVESPSPPPEEEAEEYEDMGFGLPDDVAPSYSAPLPRLTRSTAAISKNPMAITYAVEALTTIPSYGVSRKVLVAIIPFEAVITHTATPRESPIVYLQVLVPVLLLVLS